MTRSFERFSQVLRLDPETGELFWRRCGRKRTIGKPAGSISSNNSSGGGYRRIWYDGNKYLAHRIVWLLHTGDWPRNQIDHINGIKTDNRPCNLRDVTGLENTRAHFRRPYAYA